MSSARTIVDRTEWVAALIAVPAQRLLDTTKALSADWTLTPRSVPQSGLGMLKMNDGALDQPFYLGEFPLSSVHLEVTTDRGDVAEGAAQVMDDRMEIAEALAICDAVLSAQLPGWEQIADLVDQGIHQRAAARRERQLMLSATRVDFSLLDDVGENDAEY